MIRKMVNRGLAAWLMWLLAAVPAVCQPQVGERAAGMAGAFVAVADDASAVYWNPAGLATGAFVSFVLDWGESGQRPEGAADPSGGDRRTVGMVAGSLPPVGLAYYRLGSYVAGPRETAAPAVQSREDLRRSVYGLTTGHWGVTLLQSITQYVVVGATVKLVRGSAGRGESTAPGAEAAIEEAAELEGVSTSTGDIDFGAMLAVEHIRVGVVARNLTTPEFPVDEAGVDVVELPVDVRVGAAWGSGWPGVTRVVVSVDADATRRTTPSGERRDLAGGVETWWLAQRLGVRAGVRGSTIGGARAVVTAGVSAGITTGVFAEAHVGRGQEGERTWGVGARFTF